jgi:hypothetical protein
MVLRSHWRILVDYSGIFEVFITWRVAGLRLKVEVQDVNSTYKPFQVSLTYI